MATIALGLGLLAAPGCVRYVPQPLDPVASMQRLSRRSLADPGLTAFVERNARQASPEWPPGAWGLSDLTLAAFYFHPDLDVARAGWAVARAGQRTAAQRPDPSTGLSAGRNATTGTPSPWILSSVFDLTFETAGKQGARRERAAQLAEAARLHVAEVAWGVRSALRRSLEALRAAQEAAAVLTGQQALHEENVRRIEQRHAAGAVSAFELTQARAAAQQARYALRDAEGRAAGAIVQLAAAIGVPPEGLDGVTFSFDELVATAPETGLEDARSLALTNRADLLAALADYAAAEASLRLEIARQYPDVQLGPTYEFDQGDHKWSLGLNLPLPLFSRNRGPIAEAEARRTEAGARFEALQLRVIESVAGAVAAYRAAVAKRAEVDAIRDEANSQLERTDALLEAGAASRADLVALRLALGTATLGQLAAASETRLALGALEDAVQYPLGVSPSVWQVAPRAGLATGSR